MNIGKYFIYESKHWRTHLNKTMNNILILEFSDFFTRSSWQWSCTRMHFSRLSYNREHSENWFTRIIKQWIVIFRKMQSYNCGGAHTSWITRVMKIRLYTQSRVYYLSFEKEQTIAYIYISKTFPTTHVQLFLFIMYALSFGCVKINKTASWTTLLL